MESLPVLRSSALQPVANWMETNGLSVEAHFRKVGFPVELLDEPSSVVPEKPLWALFERIREKEGIVDAGFRIGASHHVTDLPNLASLLTGHPTLQKTTQAFCSLLRSHANYWDYWLEPYADGARLCRRGSPIDIGHWPVEQYVISYLADLVRMATDNSWWPHDIWLRHGGNLHKEERGWLEPARVHFFSPVTAISIPTSLLSRRPAGSDRSRSAPVLGTQIPREFVTLLRELVAAYLPLKRSCLADFAEMMGVHTRTFQRELASRDTSFQQVLNDVRVDLACARLESDDRPISEIADELGYQELAAFSKSFRRWTGVSPSAYRFANRTGIR